MGGIITFVIGFIIGGIAGAVLMGLCCANERPGRKWWEDEDDKH